MQIGGAPVTDSETTTLVAMKATCSRFPDPTRLSSLMLNQSGLIWGIKGTPPWLEVPRDRLLGMEARSHPESSSTGRLVAHTTKGDVYFDASDCSPEGIATSLRKAGFGAPWAEASACWKCGSSLVQTARFCPDCGTDQAARPDVTSQPQTPFGAPLGATRSELPAAPIAVAPAAASVGDRVALGNEFTGWALAIGPIVGLVGAAALATRIGTATAISVAWFIYIGVNTLFLWWDSVALNRRGLSSPSGALGFFLIPLYLFARQRRLGRTQVLLGVWIVAFLTTVVFQTTVVGDAGGIQLNTTRLASQIQQKAGASVPGGVVVSCPSETSAHVGQVFQCIITANADQSTYVANVTVENSSGDVVWQVQP